MITPLPQTRIPDHVICRALDGEMVLLNMDSGIYYSLNPVGCRMWELLTEKGNLEAVYEAMLAEYDVSPSALQRDLLHLAQELQSHGLIEIG